MNDSYEIKGKSSSLWGNFLATDTESNLLLHIKSWENLSVAANRLEAITVTFVRIPILMVPQCEAVNKANIKTMKLVWLYNVHHTWCHQWSDSIRRKTKYIHVELCLASDNHSSSINIIGRRITTHFCNGRSFLQLLGKISFKSRLSHLFSLNSIRYVDFSSPH